MEFSLWNSKIFENLKKIENFKKIRKIKKKLKSQEMSNFSKKIEKLKKSISNNFEKFKNFHHEIRKFWRFKKVENFKKFREIKNDISGNVEFSKTNWKFRKIKDENFKNSNS